MHSRNYLHGTTLHDSDAVVLVSLQLNFDLRLYAGGFQLLQQLLFKVLREGDSGEQLRPVVRFRVGFEQHLLI